MVMVGEVDKDSMKRKSTLSNRHSPLSFSLSLLVAVKGERDFALEFVHLVYCSYYNT